MVSSVVLKVLRERLKHHESLLGPANVVIVESLLERLDFHMESFRSLKACYNDLTRDVKRKVNGLEINLALVKCVVGETSNRGDAYAKVKVLESTHFNSDCDSIELKNFLWDID